MTTYTLSATLAQPYDAAVAATREALADQGFGILTEIDLAATMKAKLDVDLPPQVILGACRPPLAYEAISVDPSIAAVLPSDSSSNGALQPASSIATLAWSSLTTRRAQAAACYTTGRCTRR